MFTALGLNELKSVHEMFSFAGKNAMVTGAAGGIGRTVAATLAELGADVALVDLDYDTARANAEYISNKFGRNVFAIRCDVSKEEQVQEMMDIAVKKMGKIDAVHSNAGMILKTLDCADMPVDQWQKIVDVNLTGMFLVNRAAAQHMKDNGGGAIVNTASMSGHIINQNPNRHMVGYTTTKGGVLQLTKAMAMDFCKYHVRVNSVSPGYMTSGLHNGLPLEKLERYRDSVPMNRFGTMDEIGGVVAFLLSDLASYITGADLLVDGGYCAW